MHPKIIYKLTAASAASQSAVIPGSPLSDISHRGVHRPPFLTGHPAHSNTASASRAFEHANGRLRSCLGVLRRRAAAFGLASVRFGALMLGPRSKAEHHCRAEHARLRGPERLVCSCRLSLVPSVRAYARQCSSSSVIDLVLVIQDSTWCPERAIPAILLMGGAKDTTSQSVALIRGVTA